MNCINRRDFLSSLTIGMGAAMLAGQALSSDSAKPRKRPNILLAISDDQSWQHFGAYGCKGIKTPAFDRVAAEGALFSSFFAAAPQCSPNRASILTGRHIWQNREAGTHSSSFPSDLAVYPDLLEQSGYAAGYTGKPWSPGNWKISGRKRNPAGDQFNEKKLTEVPASGISKVDYAANFADFLAKKDSEKPFCFWYGGQEPHRGYESGSGLKAGKKLSDVSVPAFLPDNETVRSDILDYQLEIEWFDSHLAKMVKLLEERGELDNTLILVTADNGMPFPHSKANLYEHGVHLPLAVRYPHAVKSGLRVDELVSCVDLAPTILDAAGLTVPKEMTGRSFLPILSGAAGKGINKDWDHVLFGRERHTHARPDNVGYPSRAIRTEKYLYIWNHKPDRWPVGNPPGFEDTDGDSPTKAYILAHQKEGSYFEKAFDIRSGDELFDIEKDPGCMVNLVLQSDYAKTVTELRARLQDLLRQQGDPRVTGSEIFDSYPRYNYMRSELPGFKESGKYNPAFK